MLQSQLDARFADGNLIPTLLTSSVQLQGFRPIELNPGYEWSLEGLASCLSGVGRPEQGLVYINRLLEKNSVDVLTIFHRYILLEEIEKKRAEDDAPF